MAKALVLRTCNSEMTANKGFIWPSSGPVEAPDWNPKPACGAGLHGLLWGEGSISYLDLRESAKWLVVEIEESEAVWLDGDKVKFPRGEVRYAGTRDEAVRLIQEHPGAAGKVVAFATLTGGDGSTLIIMRWNGKRYKVHIAEVGDGGLKPGVAYRLNDAGEFVECGI